MSRTLYYGDNLTVLREHVRDETVDLIYLDPPFNPKVAYNVLFSTPDGGAPQAQIEAFVETWHWGEEAMYCFDEVMATGSRVAAILRALRSFLGESDMMAYLANMTARLIEMHRVLATRGSLYLHCDPTASHYLKIILDAVFAPHRFRNEIVWQRTPVKGLMSKRFPTNHDVILCYQKSDDAVWNEDAIFQKYDPEHLDAKTAGKYYQVDADGRRFQLTSLINPNPNRPNLTYKFLGVSRVWRWTKPRMEEAYRQGLVVQPAPGRVPRLKRYLDEQRGRPLGDVWTDINPLNSQAQERVGYPTQKPVALLERIISTSSNPGDLVLDPFCGCGTTVDAAERLSRRWIGIDVTHYAITVIENRLQQHFPNFKVEVIGRPRDLADARALASRNKMQFQWWAISLLDAHAYRGKVGPDRGVDGLYFFRNGPYGTGMVVVSVKGGDNVNPAMVRDLRGTVEREEAHMGVFITLTPPSQKMTAEAAGAGLVRTAHGAFPRMQIATIEDLLGGKRPNLPPPYVIHNRQEMRKAGGALRKAATDVEQLSFTFPIPGGKTKHRIPVREEPGIEEFHFGQ